jgi:hypothetical protein
LEPVMYKYVPLAIILLTIINDAYADNFYFNYQIQSSARTGCTNKMNDYINDHGSDKIINACVEYVPSSPYVVAYNLRVKAGPGYAYEDNFTFRSTAGATCESNGQVYNPYTSTCEDPPQPDTCTTTAGTEQKFYGVYTSILCSDGCTYHSDFGLHRPDGTSYWWGTTDGTDCTGGNTSGVNSGTAPGSPEPEPNCVTNPDGDQLCNGDVADTYNGNPLPNGQLPDDSAIANDDGSYTTSKDTYNPDGDPNGDATTVIDQEGQYSDKRVHDSYKTLPPGTAVDTNGDGIANAVAKDNNSDGITDELRNADGTTYKSDNPDGTAGTEIQNENDTGTAPPVQGDGSFEGDGDPSEGTPGEGEGEGEGEGDDPVILPDVPDGDSFEAQLTRLNAAWDASPFMGAINGASLGTDTGECPTFELAIFDTTVSTDYHCQIYSQIVAILSAVMLAAYSIIGIRIVMSA